MTQLCEGEAWTTGHAVPFRYTNDNLKGMLELHESRFRHEHSDICLWKAGGEQPDDRSNCRYNEVVMSASSSTSGRSQMSSRPSSTLSTGRSRSDLAKPKRIAGESEEGA